MEVRISEILSSYWTVRMIVTIKLNTKHKEINTDTQTFHYHICQH